MAAGTAIPRLVIAGTGSGVGKTTVTVALARALRKRGLRVAAFKCGPDYLDPTYHARATLGVSHNLDGWMMGRGAVLSTFVRGSAEADVALVEGVMGLFDGASPTTDAGSTAEIAKWLEAPVVLVVDASGMARSIGAVARGFSGFDPAIRVVGVVANRLGGAGHRDLLRAALGDPPLLGGLFRSAEHAFAERHLGLHSADESVLPEKTLLHWEDAIEEGVSVERLLELSRRAPPIALPEEAPRTSDGSPRCRIGIARDEAFHFYYADNLRRLEAAGAELVPFSPIRDTVLPAVDALYLGGGYPECHAEALARNVAFRRSVRRFVEQNGPVYAECGGFMYLTEGIELVSGERFPMVGALPGVAKMHGRLQALGYVEVATLTGSLLGATGTRFRGHQFRYSELVEARPRDTVEAAYSVRKRRGGDASAEGFFTGSTVGSYVHAHFASNPTLAPSFVESAVLFGRRRVS